MFYLCLSLSSSYLTRFSVFYLCLSLSHGLILSKKTMVNVSFWGECYVFGDKCYVFQGSDYIFYCGTVLDFLIM